MSQTASLTREAASFAANLKFADIPDDALTIARRCVLDGLAVALAGSEQPAIDVMEKYITSIGGSGESRVIGDATRRDGDAHRTGVGGDGATRTRSPLVIRLIQRIA